MSLLEWCRPSDIAGFVIPGRINAVDRHSSGAVSDFLQDFLREDREVIEPSGDHYGPLASPVFKSWVVGVCGSFFDRLPCVVEWSARPFRRIAVSFGALVAKFRARSTGGAIAASQPRCGDNALNPAIASNKPIRAVFSVRKANDGQMTVTISSDILESRHDGFSRKRLRLGMASPSTVASSRRHYSTFHVKQECYDG